MKWSLLGRRCQRGLSVYMPSSPRWPSDTAETPLAYGTLLSTTLYISQIYYKPFLTEEVQFHLHNPLFHLPSSDAVGPYRAAVMVGLLSAHWQKTGAVDLRELEHINILFSRFWLRKEAYLYAPHVDTEKYASPLTNQLLSYDPATYSLLIIASCCQVTYRHARWPTSLLSMCNFWEMNVFDKEAVSAAEVVLSTHWGHLTGAFVFYLQSEESWGNQWKCSLAP